MSRKTAYTQMLYELESLQTEMRDAWLEDSFPQDWSGLEWDSPSPRPKTRVTIRLDSEMLRWFRKMGPGYGPRINQILRIYYLALMGGGIKAYPSDDNVPRLLNSAHQMVREMRERRENR